MDLRLLVPRSDQRHRSGRRKLPAPEASAPRRAAVPAIDSEGLKFAAEQPRRAVGPKVDLRGDRVVVMFSVFETGLAHRRIIALDEHGGWSAAARAHGATSLSRGK